MQLKLPNTHAMRDLPVEQKRVAMFKSIHSTLLVACMALDMLGSKAASLLANPASRILAGKTERPTVEQIKAYLLSEAAAKFYGGSKWAVPADNPELTTVAGQFDQFFHEMPDIDLAFTALFDFVDLRGSNESSFDLIGTSMGITWEQTKPGAIIKPRREISESKTSVGYLTYQAGLSLLDDWLRYNKFYLVEDAVNEFVAKFYATFAAAHYGLFTALSTAIDVNFATDDATTFNNACAALVRGLAAKGYGVSANLTVDILTSPDRVGRILAMLEATRGSLSVAYGTQDQPIAFGVRNVIATTSVAANDTGYYVIYPGRKLKRAVWLDPVIESQREAAAGATDWFGKAQFNAAIGDSAQVKRAKFA
jgi:hypothetical protein